MITGTISINNKKKLNLETLKIVFTNFQVSSWAYNFTNCGLNAVWKLETKLYTPLLTWFDIPIAAFTITPQKTFKRSEIPCWEHTFAAFPGTKLPSNFYEKILEDIKDYPAYAVKLDDKIVGFCYLCSYKNYKTLRETAEVICYLSYDAKGKGIGYNCLKLLMQVVDILAEMGLKNLIALLSTKNKISTKFYYKYGFKSCGIIQNIVKKFDTEFGIIILKKTL